MSRPPRRSRAAVFSDSDEDEEPNKKLLASLPQLPLEGQALAQAGTAFKARASGR